MQMVQMFLRATQISQSKDIFLALHISQESVVTKLGGFNYRQPQHNTADSRQRHYPVASLAASLGIASRGTCRQIGDSRKATLVKQSMMHPLCSVNATWLATGVHTTHGNTTHCHPHLLHRRATSRRLFADATCPTQKCNLEQRVCYDLV